MPVFFERLRTELRRYADGVHTMGPPASRDAVRGLPDELASFLRSWDGADLFIDAVTIRRAADVERDGDLLVFGHTATGDRLALDLRGAPPPVVRLEEDTGEVLVEGTSFARWVEGYIVAEGVLYDREGEFREGVFDEDGEEQLPGTVERRERKALKIDPDAPAPAWRLARALEKLGQWEPAREVLARVVTRLPAFAWAWFDLGRLERLAHRQAEAETAFARAAEATEDEEQAGFFAAHAARAAAARGDDEARARHAARALALAPDVVRRQKDAARELLADGRTAEAREAAEVAAAVAPRDLEVLDLLRRTSG